MRIELDDEILELKEYRLFIHKVRVAFIEEIYSVMLETNFGNRRLETFKTVEEAVKFMKNWNQ